MKAELQIGDWVKYGSTYIKVESITKKKIGYHKKAGESRMHYVRLCEVDLITLTKEILERNGFEKISSLPDTYKYDNCPATILIKFSLTNKISIEIHNELAKKNENGAADLVTFGRDWCKDFYLHQLQQGMRFCGITKKIEL